MKKDAHILTVQKGYAVRKRHDYRAGTTEIPVPMLTLKGKWLGELGMTFKTKIKAEKQSDGSLILKILDNQSDSPKTEN